MLVDLLESRDPRTMRLSSSCPMVSAVVSPRSSSSPRLLKLMNVNSCIDHSLVTCRSLASMSFSFMADIQMSCDSTPYFLLQRSKKINNLTQYSIGTLSKEHNLRFLRSSHELLKQFSTVYNGHSAKWTLTSMSSLHLSRGASRIFLRQKPSLSSSKMCWVTSMIRCQCRGFMALLAISSSSGHMSLKSSIVRFNAWNAGHSYNVYHLLWN